MIQLDGKLLNVSKPSGMPHINSQLASLAASSISSLVTSELPKAMFSAIVPLKRTGS